MGTVPFGNFGGVPMAVAGLPEGSTQLHPSSQHIADHYTPFVSDIPYVPDNPRPACRGVTVKGAPCGAPRAGEFEFCIGHAKAVSKVVGHALVNIAAGV